MPRKGRSKRRSKIVSKKPNKATKILSAVFRQPKAQGQRGQQEQQGRQRRQTQQGQRGSKAPRKYLAAFDNRAFNEPFVSSSDENDQEQEEQPKPFIKTKTKTNVVNELVTMSTTSMALRSRQHDVCCVQLEKPKGLPRGISSKERPRAKQNRSTEFTLNPYAPSTLLPNLTINGAAKKKFKMSNRTWDGQRNCHGMTDLQINDFLRKTGFEDYDRESSLFKSALKKGNVVVSLAGSIQLRTGTNTVKNVSTNAADTTVNNDTEIASGTKYSKDKQKQQKTAVKTKKRGATFYSEFGQEQWNEIVNEWNTGKHILIIVTRDFVSAQQLGKNVGRGTSRRSYKLQGLSTKPTHIGVLSIKDKEILFYDCNNFPFSLENWMPKYYDSVKNVVITNVLKAFPFDLEGATLFDIPATTYCFSVKNSCSLYILFAIEQISKGRENTDLNKLMAQGYLFFEKVAHFNQCHKPIWKYSKKISKSQPSEFIYEELLDKICNGKKDYTRADLEKAKEQVKCEMRKSGKMVMYDEIVSETSDVETCNDEQVSDDDDESKSGESDEHELDDDSESQSYDSDCNELTDYESSYNNICTDETSSYEESDEEMESD